VALGYARPKGATPLRFALVPAYTGCTNPNGQHGAPLSVPSCNPTHAASDFLTVGTSDANGQPTNFAGSVSLEAVAGDPLTPADDADVGLKIQLTDVRRKADLADYTGQLQVVVPIRVTDRLNNFGGEPFDQPATATDSQLAVTVPCSATADTTVGATCSADTTADAVTPGIVPEGRRTIWELGQILVYDGGPDGVVSTSNNTLFATQGTFAP
jgi:hypothetical protein